MKHIPKLKSLKTAEKKIIAFIMNDKHDQMDKVGYVKKQFKNIEKELEDTIIFKQPICEKPQTSQEPKI